MGSGFPIRNKEAETVAKVLVEQVFCRFGVLVSLLSDRGTEIEAVSWNKSVRWWVSINSEPLPKAVNKSSRSTPLYSQRCIGQDSRPESARLGYPSQLCNEHISCQTCLSLGGSRECLLTSFIRLPTTRKWKAMLKNSENEWPRHTIYVNQLEQVRRKLQEVLWLAHATQHISSRRPGVLLQLPEKCWPSG